MEDCNEGLLRSYTSDFSIDEKLDELKLTQYAPRLMTHLNENPSPFLTYPQNFSLPGEFSEFNFQINLSEEDCLKFKDTMVDNKTKKSKNSDNLLNSVTYYKDDTKFREEYLKLKKEEKSKAMGTTLYEQKSLSRFKDEAPKLIEGCANGCPAFLVCDDDPFNIKVLQNFLRVHELPIETAYHGDNAIEKVKNRWENENCCKNFRLIFMDIEMPVKNGFEAAQEIILFWKEKGEIGCPIVATTGYVDEEENEKMLKSGMIERISKPINHRELRELVERLLVK